MKPKSELDPFLREAVDQPTDAEALTALADLLPRVEPPADLRSRIMMTIAQGGRLARFAASVARALDIAVAQAEALLNGVDDEKSWGPGPLPQMGLFHVSGGPAVANAIAGFIRLPAGYAFPEHKHLGEETVVVVQGSYRDGVSGAVVRAGDVAQHPAGSSHGFVVLDGPDLIYLGVTQTGVEMGGRVFGPEDTDL